MSSRRVALLCAAISLVFAAVGTTIGVSVASHDFPDVGDGSFFHDAIDQIAGAGCATGFPDGNFQPQSDVRRQQFAYWLNNCGGRVETVTVEGVDFITEGDQIPALAELEVETGGVPDDELDPGQWGLWYVVADIDVQTSDDQQTTWVLQRENLGGGSFADLDDDILSVTPPAPLGGGALAPTASGTMTAVVESQAGRLETFRVGVERENGAPNALLDVRLTAMYFPFNGLGEAHTET